MNSQSEFQNELKNKFYFEIGLYEKLEKIKYPQFSKIEELIKSLVAGEQFYEDGKVLYNGFHYTIKDDLRTLELVGDQAVSKNKNYTELNKITLTRKNDDSQLIFYVQVGDDYIQKIGQYPSYYDLLRLELTKDFEKELINISSEDWKNYKKALQLFSHGFGIGAYAYLRRVFEDIIRTTFNRTTFKENKFEIFDKEENEVRNEKDFKDKKMEDKIRILEKYLPRLMEKFPKIIYSTLSEGIHELSEEVCFEKSKTLKAAIKSIIDERVEKCKKEKNIRDLEIEIQNL